MRKSTLAVSGVLAVAIVVGSGVGGAYAKSLITGSDIKDGTVTGADIKNESLNVGDFTAKAQHALKGAKGDKGDKGANGLTGAYYAVAYYNKGDTNAGAIATVRASDATDAPSPVACRSWV